MTDESPKQSPLGPHFLPFPNCESRLDMHQPRMSHHCLAIGLILSTLGCGSTAPTDKLSAATKPASPSKGTADAQSGTPVAANPPKAAPAESKPAAEANSIELRELDWNTLQELVATNRGKVVVVDIWSTSCEPCIREFPNLVALKQRHPDDVIAISFNCDYDGRKTRPVAYYRERVLKFLTSQKAESIVNGMCTTAAEDLFKQIDVDSIPAVFVYDRTGKLARRFDNRTPVSETEKEISYKLQIDPLVADLVKADKN